MEAPPGHAGLQYSLPPGVISVCPRVNFAEDIRCFTPDLGAWYHRGDTEMTTCAELRARNCCMLVVDGVEGGDQWAATGCGRCNFAVGVSEDACFAMFRPPAGLQACAAACAAQAAAAAPP